MDHKPLPGMKTYYRHDTLEVGIDEAGRGPLFGRVYVGAAILPPDPEFFNHSLMRDSKKLTPRRRLMAFDYIKDYAIDWSIGWRDEKHIDEYNILEATFDAMHDAIDQLLVRPQHLLVDGDRFRIYMKNKKIIPHTCIEEGDAKYTPIAAASILAKVGHDQYIEKLCDEHSYLNENYGLLKNKGYGTKQHIEGISIHGCSPWHRMSFGPCKDHGITHSI